MSVLGWIWVALSILGVIAFSVLVWFAGPLIFIADVQPFESVWLRLTLIAIAVLLTLGVILFKVLRRRRAERALEAGIAQANAAETDAPVLADKMRDALATLKGSSKARGNYLYDLPWYLIIGPPGAGKTTALVNSGLKFPLAQGKAAAAIEGVGGTRYCDWWFTDRAVLIDTAGRYTTQDSDAKADSQSWLSFLKLLKDNRPRQPINGVIVAISIEDVLTAPPAEVAAHADAIRKRLSELHEQLKVNFPVYAVFTKMDLVSGFMQYFADLDEARRQVVWGATFQTADKSANKIADVPAEFDLLLQRLIERLPERLQDEPDLRARAILFGFPAQMAAVKSAVSGFLTRIFEPTRYQTNATLRGFYFTSGTQEGTPFDQVIGALQRSYGVESYSAAAFSGVGKSFFLHDLLEKVIFGEAGWVSINLAAVRWAFMLRAAVFGTIAAVSLAVLGVWWMSYERNHDLIARTDKAVDAYKQSAATLLEQTEVSDIDLRPVYSNIDALLNLPTGYATRALETPTQERFGLSQRPRLHSASVSAYQAALERLLRPRLILRLEQQIQKNIADPSFVYEALKIYLMLGGKAPKVDNDLIVSWFAQDWEQNMYPGPAFAQGRDLLRQHLVAMLDMDVGGSRTISLNGPLVEQAQATLVRLSVAERAYTLLKSEAHSLAAEDWIAARRGGPDTELVFETANGSSLDTVRVPAFFTYSGFYDGLLKPMVGIAEKIRNESWVLGVAGDQSAVKEQYQTLLPDIIDLYGKEFIASWNAALSNLRLRPLVADKPKYLALSAASAQTSPIKQVFESVSRETALTRDRKPEGEQASLGEQVAGQVAGDVAQNAASRLGNTANAALELAMKSQRRAGDDPTLVPGANIEANFKVFHVLTDGDAGTRPIDALVANLNEIYRNLALAATNPAQAQQAVAALQVQVASLRANASRIPEPLSEMMRTVATDVEGDATSTSIAELTQAMADQVTAPCQQVVTNKYPFAKTDRDVPMADFAGLFAPNGKIDRFFFTNLAPMVDMSGKTWVWRSELRQAQDLSLATLRQFQQAAQIRDAFFPTGGNQPSVNMEVKPVTLSGEAESATLQINSTAIVAQPGANTPASLIWPGPGVNQASITIQPELPDRNSRLERKGAWALFRLLDAGSVLQRGNVVSASFVVGGREVSFQFSVATLQNPLTLPALRQFKCPNGL